MLKIIEEVRMVEKLIQSNPSVMMGKPVIAGTRITVELILEKLAAGETVEQILDAHPHLTKNAIQAAQIVKDGQDKIKGNKPDLIQQPPNPDQNGRGSLDISG